jgi:hypothetical protein
MDGLRSGGVSHLDGTRSKRTLPSGWLRPRADRFMSYMTVKQVRAPG